MSKNGSTPESVRTLSGSYRLDGKEHSYKVTIHGPTRAEAARVLSDKGRASLRETTRDSCAGQLGKRG